MSQNHHAFKPAPYYPNKCDAMVMTRFSRCCDQPGAQCHDLPPLPEFCEVRAEEDHRGVFAMLWGKEMHISPSQARAIAEALLMAADEAV